MVDLPSFSEFVDLDGIKEEINFWTKKFEIKNKQGPREQFQYKNAFAHAYASAVITYEYHELFSNFLGNSREYRSFLTDTYKAMRGRKGFSVSGVFRDGHRDMYNNHIGNQIGRLAWNNDLPRDALAYLVADAVKTDKLVADEFNDERVGPLTFDRPFYGEPSPEMRDQIREMFGVDISVDDGGGRRGRNRRRRHLGTEDVSSPDGSRKVFENPGPRGRNRPRRSPRPGKPQDSSGAKTTIEGMHKAEKTSLPPNEDYGGRRARGHVSPSPLNPHTIGLSRSQVGGNQHSIFGHPQRLQDQAMLGRAATRQPLLELLSPSGRLVQPSDGDRAIGLRPPSTPMFDGLRATSSQGGQVAPPSITGGDGTGLPVGTSRLAPVSAPQRLARLATTPESAERAIADLLMRRSLPHLDRYLSPPKARSA